MTLETDGEEEADAPEERCGGSKYFGRGRGSGGVVGTSSAVEFTIEHDESEVAIAGGGGGDDGGESEGGGAPVVREQGFAKIELAREAIPAGGINIAETGDTARVTSDGSDVANFENGRDPPACAGSQCTARRHPTPSPTPCTAGTRGVRGLPRLPHVQLPVVSVRCQPVQALHAS